MKTVYREKTFKYSDGLHATGDLTVPHLMRNIVFSEKHTEYNSSIVFTNVQLSTPG